jgi:hypothetical protein
MQPCLLEKNTREATSLLLLRFPLAKSKSVLIFDQEMSLYNMGRGIYLYLRPKRPQTNLVQNILFNMKDNHI